MTRISVGPGLGVDADDAAHQALGRGDVDVAGAGDEIHRVEPEARHAVGERADRAGTAHRVDLLDAEDAGGAQDRRVHSPAELGLRRRGERDRRDAGHLRGNDVHHDARRDRRPCRPARRSRRARSAASAGSTCGPGPRSVTAGGGTCASLASRTRRIASSSAARTAGSSASDRGGDVGGIDSDRGRPHAVEALGLIEQGRLRRSRARRRSAAAAVSRRDRDVDLRPRDQRHQLGATGSAAAEVERLDHVVNGGRVEGWTPNLEITDDVSAFKLAFRRLAAGVSVDHRPAPGRPPRRLHRDVARVAGRRSPDGHLQHGAQGERVARDRADRARDHPPARRPQPRGRRDAVARCRAAIRRRPLGSRAARSAAAQRRAGLDAVPHHRPLSDRAERHDRRAHRGRLARERRTSRCCTTSARTGSPATGCAALGT